jgi:hypothetical protein
MRKLVPLLVMVACCSGSLAASKTLDEYREIYERKRGEILEECGKAATNAVAAYGKDIARLRKERTAAGDLEAALALKAEDERFRGDESVPSDEAAPLHTAVEQARNACAAALDGAALQRDRKLVTLTAQYTKRLRAAQMAFVLKDAIEEALLVRKEIDRVEGLVPGAAKPPEQGPVAAHAPTVGAAPAPAQPGREYVVHRWPNDGKSIVTIGSDEGICFLTGVGGSFAGGGERVHITLDGRDDWTLGGRRGQGSTWGTASHTRWPGKKRTLVFEEYGHSQKGAVTRLVHQREGLCLLMGIGGAMHGGGEKIQLFVDKEGYWQVSTQSAAGGLTAWTCTVKQKLGAFQVKTTEYNWRRGSAPVKMIHKDTGFCYLSGVKGGLNGGGEAARVYIGDDGYWYLKGQTRAGTMELWAIAVEL